MDSLILAKASGHDVFNALDLMQNVDFLRVRSQALWSEPQHISNQRGCSVMLKLRPSTRPPNCEHCVTPGHTETERYHNRRFQVIHPGSWYL